MLGSEKEHMRNQMQLIWYIQGIYILYINVLNISVNMFFFRSYFIFLAGVGNCKMLAMKNDEIL